jgi:hypothetical protein
VFLTDFIRDGFRRELLHVLNRGESVNALLELATAAQVVSDAGAMTRYGMATTHYTYALLSFSPNRHQRDRAVSFAYRDGGHAVPQLA